jgi:hypothetical protein
MHSRQSNTRAWCSCLYMEIIVWLTVVSCGGAGSGLWLVMRIFPGSTMTSPSLASSSPAGTPPAPCQLSNSTFLRPIVAPSDLKGFRIYYTFQIR